MASFEGVDLTVGKGGGAIFEIANGQIDREFAYSLEGGGNVLLLAKGEVAIVRALHSSNYEECVAVAREGANRALDMSLLKAGAPLFLDHHRQPQVVWWRGATGVTLRIVSVIPLTMRLSITGVVRNAEGDIVRTPPPPQDDWDESLRFYRTSEASSDLFDSFRNLYLAIEALLSVVSPPEIKPSGRPEPESDWLPRVLRQVQTVVDLEPFAPPGPKAPHNAIYEELYGALRTAIFHAKRGRSVWLPQEWTNRDRITEARERYARMFRDLAKHYLNVSFGGSGLSKHGFAAMAEAMVKDATVYVSDDPTRHVDEPKGEYQIAPAGGRVFRLPTAVASEFADDFTAGVVGHESGDVIMGGVDAIRRFGTLQNEQLAMVENLAGALDVSGVDRVEVILIATNRNHGAPRRDFDS